ncbi:MAG TPA: CHY zinc finger protein, partial [Candidatus Sulfotelmatobacter sp.]|nr:CHY zinc finger protein [Candidatus Sulfotelmatobacter sp.]
MARSPRLDAVSYFAWSAMLPKPLDVRGVNLDAQTRCEHYHGPTDIIAIKMKCCGVYYACKDCHETLAGHPIEVWSEREWTQKAILCGACRAELTIHQYMQCESRCPTCRERFNPGCRNHYHFYFAAGQCSPPLP